MGQTKMIGLIAKRLNSLDCLYGYTPKKVQLRECELEILIRQMTKDGRMSSSGYDRDSQYTLWFNDFGYKLVVTRKRA